MTVLSLVLMITCGIALTSTSRVGARACIGCEETGDGIYTQNTAVSHSPVASSYFYSKVQYHTNGINLLDSSLYSDLAMSYRNIYSYGDIIVFEYRGVDSN